MIGDEQIGQSVEYKDDLLREYIISNEQTIGDKLNNKLTHTVIIYSSKQTPPG